MTDWWEGLTALEQVFYYCAIPATIILVIQTLLSILGIGNGDGDVDFDSDVDGDTSIDSDFDGAAGTAAESTGIDAIESASSLKFFSIRGIVAFFSLFGWVGVVLAEEGLNILLIFFIATICGLIGMFVIAMMFYMISNMQRNGNINIKNAIGNIGQVYLTIPAKQSGQGKILITIQERYTEVSAMTNSSKPLSTGTLVHVVDVIDINTLLVEKQD
jgi:membrane protein implicated in regulation of membrane protease activity